MSTTQQQPLKTLGEIATEVGVRPYSVAYAISSRGIRETQRAGIVRLFDAAAVDQIKMALAEIASSGATEQQQQQQ